MSVTRSLRTLVLLLGLGLALVGCDASITVRGSAPTDEELVIMRKGVDEQSDVQDRFGLPITVSPADSRVWYYVRQELQQRPLNPPLVLDQRVVVMRFDDNGVLQDYEVVNGIIGDPNLRPDPESSEIYGPDRNAAQALFNTIFGQIGFGS